MAGSGPIEAIGVADVDRWDTTTDVVVVGGGCAGVGAVDLRGQLALYASFTLGGVSTDTAARAFRSNGTALGGLFVVGCTAAGIPTGVGQKSECQSSVSRRLNQGPL